VPLFAGVAVGGTVGVFCPACGVVAGGLAAGGTSYLVHRYVDHQSVKRSAANAAIDASGSVALDTAGRALAKKVGAALASDFHLTLDPPLRPVYRAKPHSFRASFAGVVPAP
jgi:hypothetical protein